MVSTLIIQSRGCQCRPEGVQVHGLVYLLGPCDLVIAVFFFLRNFLLENLVLVGDDQTFW